MQAVINDQVWSLGDSIGSGGFGQVYEAVVEGRAVAVKLVPKHPAAHREMLFAEDLGGVPHIVPVIGVGELGDSYAIGMERAEQSLRDYLETVGRALTQAEALPILIDIAEALVSLTSKDVVHRDLKPENLLLLNGHWCLTDFGISRYAAAATAPDTRKYSMTPEYAAPEQWREERATSATDIYACGIIAYELLRGTRPFSGPDLRHQHLHEAAPSLAVEADTALRSIIDECLLKPAGARPTPTRLLERLHAQTNAEAPSGGAAALREAHQQQVHLIGERTRRESAAKSEEARRADLFGAACSLHSRILTRLMDTITTNAPSASGSYPVRLGNAELAFTEPTRSKPPADVPRLPFDVIAHTYINVDQPPSSNGYRGRSHSLWYCDAQEAGVYQWFEIAFMDNVFVQMRSSGQAIFHKVPYAAEPAGQVARGALAPGIGMHQLAWPFTALVDESLTEFISRWAQWFAEASRRQLQYPRSMPERQVEGSWRRG